MANDSYTEDLGDIIQGARERRQVLEILTAWDKTGLPDDFYSEGVKIAFNRTSGNIFLVNEDCQYCMVNNDKLESFYTTPYNGCEGFWDDLVDEYKDMHPDDQEYMRDIANGRELPELEG